MAPVRRTKEELFIAKIDKTDISGCWHWKGKINTRGRGYGDFAYRPEIGSKPVTEPAHRVAYKMWVGPIPEGHHIDHVWPICQYTDCVNPDHLEAVTPAENTRRYLASKTHCKAGHAYSEWGFQGTTGMRCRKCTRTKNQAYYRRINPADAPKPPPQTHCKSGHEFTEENTYLNPAGSRVCRECQRERTRRWQEKQRTLPST